MLREERGDHLLVGHLGVLHREGRNVGELAAPDVEERELDEIALAVADFDCQEKFGYQKLFETVRIEAESQFVQEHRAELERYRDSLTGGGG